MTEQEDPQFCTECGLPLILVEHYEFDGVEPNGSYEPYYECPEGHEQEEK